MNKGSFAGKVLIVDLAANKTEQMRLDDELAERYIGGLGINIKLYHDFHEPGSDALDAENVVVLGVGPLVGTGLPSTSRVFAVSKLPSSQSVGWCGAGGVNFGCQLKNTGFDHIVIKGKANHPVYLKITDNDAAILDAAPLWGKGIDETCDELWRDYEPPAGVLAIGQAGENKVLYSMAFIDRMATLGRGGLGAVLGSKNLKAIVVRGKSGITVANRKAYKNLSKALLEKIRNYPYLKEWQEQGMIKSFPVVPLDLYQKIKKRRIACVSCPIGCKDMVEVPDGEFKGLTVYTSSAINLFTPVAYGMKDYRSAIKLVSALDSFGLDVFEFFGIMKFVRALNENAIIPFRQMDVEIDYGELDSMESWAEKIALRQGLGDVLAKGFTGIVEEFGAKAKSFAPALIKGMHPYTGPGSALPWDLFGTMELGQILDPRGPHVGSGGSPTYFAKRPLEVFPKHFKRMGIPEEATERIIVKNQTGESELKVGRLLKYSHLWFALLGSMGICVRGQVNRFYSADLCAPLYEAVTGIPTDVTSLNERVKNIWTLLQEINRSEHPGTDLREFIPEQWTGNSGFKDYLTGRPTTKQGIEAMIQDYYDEWGWES